MSLGVIQNHIRLQALAAQGVLSTPRAGLVTSYDPANYAVKVTLQPDSTETGWLPIVTMQAGVGWGVYFGPQIGDQALIVFQEGSVEVGFCLGFVPSDSDQPPNVPAGEGLIKHKDGAFLRFLPGAVVALEAAGGFNIKANTAVDGTLTATKDITDNLGSNTKTVKNLRDGYDAHKHLGVTTGSGVSGLSDHIV